MTIRKIFFWLHLGAGTVGGVVIMIMSVTGVLLTYERQMIAWADRGYRSVPTAAAPARASVETLLATVRDSQHALPATLTLRSDPAAPAEASFGRERTLYLDAYSGEVLGEGSRGIRTFFRAMTDWHRWLGASGEGRATARAITGACNLAFLFLVLSGIYMWWPKKWTWQYLRPITWFRGGLSGKARDFNWHNVIGLYCAVPLFFVVVSGVVMSYPWANNLIYRLTGTEAPTLGSGPRPGGPGGSPRPAGPGGPQRGGGARPEGPAAPPGDLSLEGFDKAWTRAEQQVTGWETITLRLPTSNRAPLAISIDQSHRGRPDLRSTLTINRRSGEIMRVESFSDNNLGRRTRTWLRWIHTGEAGGVVGQTLAGIVSAGGAVLVWTGLALAWRRFRAWRARKRSKAERREDVLVHT